VQLQVPNQDLKIARMKVREKMSKVDEGDYFSIMEVADDATGYEIRKAYRRLRGAFAVERFAALELEDLQAEAEVIRFVLDETYEILRNPVLREVYRRSQNNEA